MSGAGVGLDVPWALVWLLGVAFAVSLAVVRVLVVSRRDERDYGEAVAAERDALKAECRRLRKQNGRLGEARLARHVDRWGHADLGVDDALAFTAADLPPPEDQTLAGLDFPIPAPVARLFARLDSRFSQGEEQP